MKKIIVLLIVSMLAFQSIAFADSSNNDDPLDGYTEEQIEQMYQEAVDRADAEVADKIQRSLDIQPVILNEHKFNVGTFATDIDHGSSYGDPLYNTISTLTNRPVHTFTDMTRMFAERSYNGSAYARADTDESNNRLLLMAECEPGFISASVAEGYIQKRFWIAGEDKHGYIRLSGTRNVRLETYAINLFNAVRSSYELSFKVFEDGRKINEGQIEYNEIYDFFSNKPTYGTFDKPIPVHFKKGRRYDVVLYATFKASTKGVGVARAQAHTFRGLNEYIELTSVKVEF